jgi:hypothetical protein
VVVVVPVDSTVIISVNEKGLFIRQLSLLYCALQSVFNGPESNHCITSRDLFGAQSRLTQGVCSHVKAAITNAMKFPMHL